MDFMGNQGFSRIRCFSLIVVASMALLCGCGVKQTNKLSFVMPDGRPLTSPDTILIVFDFGNTLPPTFCDILRWTIFRWFGIESFYDPMRLRLCHNESRQLNDTGQIQIPKSLSSVSVYLFTLENEEPFIYYSRLHHSVWDSADTTTVALLPLNATDKDVPEMKEEWADLFGHILLAKNDLLSDEQIAKLRHYITPTASEAYFETCFYISPETLREKAKEYGIEVRK